MSFPLDGFDSSKLDESEGLSDYRLSEIVGLSHVTLHRYRKGERSQGKNYEQVMGKWKPIGDRWYRRN